MSETSYRCESCSMPIESAPYCEHCVDADGNLAAFEERFERMVQWVTQRSPEVSRSDAERQTLDFMATMPAWKDHPELAERRRA